MKPLFHPHLVNGPQGDPVVYIDYLFEKRALLLDLGDIQRLPARKLLRLSDVFISHAHMDHFIGFDYLLRICLGRDRALNLFGPPGIIEQVGHKLAAYTWNLVQNYANNFTLTVTEVREDSPSPTARFSVRERFRRVECDPRIIRDGVLLDEETFLVRFTVLDHSIPCLAFALEEKRHLNIWKNRLDEMGLPTGPWLRELKAAIRRGEPEDLPIHIRWSDRNGPHERTLPLGTLRREVVHAVPGQKIVFVVDTVYHEENARRVIELARGADILFIETVFLQQDAGHAREKFHLTAQQGGQLARRAQVNNMVPMHFSARYTGEEEKLWREAYDAFTAKNVS